jgi:hypothetical protein
VVAAAGTYYGAWTGWSRGPSFKLSRDHVGIINQTNNTDAVFFSIFDDRSREGDEIDIIHTSSLPRGQM